MALTDITRYCEFFQLQGRRTVQTAGTVWVEVRRNVFQQSPAFHDQRDLAEEASQMLSQSRGLVARWFTPVPQHDGQLHQKQSQTPLYLIRPPYGLDCLGANARSHTRRGLKRVEVRPTEFSAVESQAFAIYEDNGRRLGLFRSDSSLRLRWGQWVKCLSASPGVEFWGAWEQKRMLAFSVVLHSPWGAEIVLQRSLGSALKLYPNNALLYRLASSVFERGVPVLSFGLGEFGASRGGLDHFKRGMRFEEVRLDNHFTWHPRLRWLKFVFSPARVEWLARIQRNTKDRWSRLLPILAHNTREKAPALMPAHDSIPKPAEFSFVKPVTKDVNGRPWPESWRNR
jgi:hypothetical protein